MRVVVGLGSNVGDRLANLRAAVVRLAGDARARVLARSRIYETAPVGGPPQDDFLNAAVSVMWSGEPLELLEACLTVERALGRVRDVRFGPRTIDLDILWIEGRASADARLIVPHPRLKERAFALAPLLDVAPDATDPTTGVRYAVTSLAGVRQTDLALST